MSMPAQAQGCAAPDLAGRQQIWTGTVTVGARTLFGRRLWHGFGADGVSIGMLSDMMFDLGLNNYTIDGRAVFVAGNPGSLTFSLSSSLTTNEVASR